MRRASSAHDTARDVPSGRISTTAGDPDTAGSPERSRSAAHSGGTGTAGPGSGASSCAAGASTRASSHRSTTSANAGSSGVRCEAEANRCTSACGTRARQSRRNHSVNTGSRGPHATRVGTPAAASSPIPALTASSAGRLGCCAPTGTSATNASIPARSAGVEYGAR